MLLSVPDWHAKKLREHLSEFHNEDWNEEAL